MQNRRSFLKLSGAAVAGGLFASKAAMSFAPEATHPVGLQLFTLFDILDNDVKGNLTKVAAIGYKEIESAFSKKGGFYGMSAKDFSSLLGDLGLTWKSHHVLGAPFKLPPNTKMPLGADGKPFSLPPVKNLRENMQEIVDTAAAAGFPYLVCANTPFDSKEELKKSIDTLNQTAASAKKAGLIFCYHNHDKEFEMLDGKMIYDRLLQETNPDEMKMELDLCWVTKANVDPVALFKANPGRFPLWHVKDLDKERQGPAPVGTGVVDFKRIFANAEISGMKDFFVEHDFPKDPFGSITTSFNNVEKILMS